MLSNEYDRGIKRKKTVVLYNPTRTSNPKRNNALEDDLEEALPPYRNSQVSKKKKIVVQE